MRGNSLATRLFGPLRRLFDLRRRTTRRDFWPYMLFLLAGWLGCLFAVSLASGSSPLVIISWANIAEAGWFLQFDALFAPFILLGFAAVVRRLHDVGVNALPMIVYALLDGAAIGCFYLLAHHSHRIGGSNAQRGVEQMLGLLLGTPGFLMRLCFFALVVLCARNGTRGANRYGPDPTEGART